MSVIHALPQLHTASDWRLSFGEIWLLLNLIRSWTTRTTCINLVCNWRWRIIRILYNCESKYSFEWQIKHIPPLLWLLQTNLRTAAIQHSRRYMQTVLTLITSSSKSFWSVPKEMKASYVVQEVLIHFLLYSGYRNLFLKGYK